MQPRLNLTQKFLAFLMLAAVLPLLIVGTAAYRVSSEMVRDEAIRSTRTLVDSQLDYLDLQAQQIAGLIANLLSVEEITAALASEGQLSTYASLATQARIGYLLDGYTNLQGLVSIDIFTLSGAHYHVGDTLDVSQMRTDVRDRLILQTRANGPQVFWAGIEDNINASSRQPQVITVSRLVLNTDRGSPTSEPVGVVLVNSSIADLHDHFGQINLGAGAYLTIMDGQGRVMCHPDTRLIGSTINNNILKRFAQPRGTFTQVIDNKAILITYARSELSGWTVFSVVPIETLDAQAEAIRLAMLLAFGVACVSIGLAAVFASKMIVAPLRDLIRRLQLLQASGPGWEAPLQVRGADEVAELGHWFNTFLETLIARSRAEDQLRHKALHDALTGLPNRVYLMEQLEAPLAQARLSPQPSAAVLFLDFDRFKLINDSLGHAAGDEVLRCLAHRMKAALRPTDILARLGGDEFVIVLNPIDSPTAVTHLAAQLQEQLAQPMEIQGLELTLHASIGVVLVTGGYTHGEELLRDADIAMYAAKASGRACTVIFDTEMHAQTLQRIRIEADLRRAIDRNELCVHYQPILSLQSAQVHSFEALVRWRHPEHGLIPPGAFIPIAEETGLIQAIDIWVLRMACRQLAVWNSQGHETLTVSVNLSARNFRDSNLPQIIRQILEDEAVPPTRVQLEITESTVMVNIDHTGQLLEELNAMGLRIAIDDFGTNYSSLAYLKRLPADSVKIDRSFISDVTENRDAAAITNAIIAIGHILGLTVIAEGVETAEQCAFLREHLCDAIQGYVISPPVEAEAAAQLLSMIGEAPAQASCSA